MSRFNKWWLRGWTVILAVAVLYELIAFSFELRGIRDYPTLSTILVTTLGLGHSIAVPLPGHGIAVSLLDALTVVVALVLLWHWHDLKSKLQMANSGLRKEMQRIWSDSGFPAGDRGICDPDDVEQYDFVTRDKRDGKYR